MLWDKGKNFLSWAEEFPWPWFKPLNRRNWRPAWYATLKGNFLRNLFWMPFQYTDADQKQCSALFSCDILDYLWLCNIKQIMWLVMLSHQPWTSASSGLFHSADLNSSRAVKWMQCHPSLPVPNCSRASLHIQRDFTLLPRAGGKAKIGRNWSIVDKRLLSYCTSPEMSILKPVLPLASLLVSSKLLTFIFRFIKWETGGMRSCKTRWKLTWIYVLFTIMSFAWCTAFCKFTTVPPLPEMLTNSFSGYMCRCEELSQLIWKLQMASKKMLPMLHCNILCW